MSALDPEYICSGEYAGKGEHTGSPLRLNDAGRMVEKWYWELPNKYPGIILDEYVVMPNHFHCIIVKTIPVSAVGVIVQWFKTMTTNEYIRNVKQNGWQVFSGRLWQRNYYEHIVRDEDDLNCIREYIKNNPWNWEKDNEYQM